MRIATVVVFAALVMGCSETDPDPASAPDSNGTTNTTDVGNTSGGADLTTGTALTYYRDIKPIIDGRCLGCHTTGEIGPFPLHTYEDVAPLKDLISTVVHTRTMPPFLPSPGCNEYVGDPSLSNEQIAIVKEWAAGGAPAGDPDDAGEPLYPPAGATPVFDTTLEMTDAYTPQLRPDDYRCFVLDWPHQSTKYITGFGVEPGDARIVHHIIAYHASPALVAQAEAADAAEDGPGYTCFGGPGLDGEYGQAPWLGSWAPGGAGAKFASGTGLPVEPGSKVVIQVHYNTLSVEPVPDKTRLKFETANSVAKPAFFRLWANPAWLTTGAMRIPAGDPAVTHRFSLDPTLVSNGRPITLYGGSIHMHLLGSQATSYVLRGNGATDCLFQIDNYDFGWQGGTGFATPVTISAGDKLVIECTWDNSAANQPMINGERTAPADRAWGEGTTDEMCLGIFYATID